MTRVGKVTPRQMWEPAAETRRSTSTDGPPTCHETWFLTARSPFVMRICAFEPPSTNVLHRDGRRSRPWRADVAQLVAHHLAKVRVAGSNPVIRSKVRKASTPAVEWPSGEATACKAVHTGSIPVSTSNSSTSAISSAGERFPDTEEVTGSIPVSRTIISAAQAGNFGLLLFLCPIRAQSAPVLTFTVKSAHVGVEAVDSVRDPIGRISWSDRCAAVSLSCPPAAGSVCSDVAGIMAPRC